MTSIRAVTSPSFCIGIKLNSVDVDPSTPSSLADTMEQIQLLIEAGIDFIEISGGTYENPRMMAEPGENVATTGLKESTVARESFFLSFAAEVRARFPTVLLMVTGGFRTRIGMEAALQSSACDMIGIGRPAAVLPGLPKEIILNEAVQDENASVVLERLPVPWLARAVPIKQIGAGWQSLYYAGQIQRMGNGLEPVDTRVKI
jgi:2,4-dienoyl-CoA reductase-like NADH-dependent reductase (Old Yellow Enzyme family)